MSLGDHLDELRRRLLISVITLLVCVVALLPFKSQVTEVFMRPYRQMWGMAFADYYEALEKRAADTTGEPLHAVAREELDWLRQYQADIRARQDDVMRRVHGRGGFPLQWQLTATTPLADFWTFLAASLLISVMLASPVILYQVWAFVAAGLYVRERRAVYRVVPLSLALTIAGVLFGYWYVVPYAMYFLTGMMGVNQVAPLYTVNDYFKLLFLLTVALAIVFQLPIFMLTLQKVGLVTHRGLVKYWRFIIVGCFVVGAVLTPPDPVTQLLMAVPMVCLYMFGLLLTWNVDRRQRAAV